MQKPKLVVMAAGLGSRYGGLKQMESMTPQDEIILDFACYDAWKAGFDDIIFIIKPEMEEDFHERVLKRMSRHVNCEYVFQTMDALPEGYYVPEGRVKPWGTCHAVLAAKDKISGPFAVINADDYYGKDAFRVVYRFLEEPRSENEYCMAGYYVEKTLSDQGTVTRGICKDDDQGMLTGIVETSGIGWSDGVGSSITAGGEVIPPGTPVSMNFWGFQRSMIDYMERDFVPFLEKALAENPEKGEFLLPIEVGELLQNGKISVQVLPAKDQWYGVTYKEDREKVVAAFARMKAEGSYPEVLWP